MVPIQPGNLREFFIALAIALSAVGLIRLLHYGAYVFPLVENNFDADVHAENEFSQ